MLPLYPRSRPRLIDLLKTVTSHEDVSHLEFGVQGYDTDGYKYSPSEVSSWEDYCWDADESAAVPTTGTLEAALRCQGSTEIDHRRPHHEAITC